MEELLSNYLQHARQPEFWLGGFSLLVGAFIFLWFVGRVVAAWNTINQFFTPTKKSDKPGPSPFRRVTNCLFSALFLFAILTLLTVLLISLLRA